LKIFDILGGAFEFFGARFNIIHNYIHEDNTVKKSKII